MKERKIGEVFEFGGEWYQCVKSPDGCCKHCDMNFGGKCPIPTKECIAILRSDLSYVIFKKLEKIGEPFSDEYFGLVQKYELKMYGYSTTDKRVCFADGYDVFIKIKQNKEDMEEKKIKLSQDDIDWLKKQIRWAALPGYITHEEDYDRATEEIMNLFIPSDTEHSSSEKIGKNLKPFDLEAAKAGKPVCTRDGRKVRIVCFDRINAKPILALVPSTDGKGEDVFDYFVSGKRIANALESDLDLMMLSEKKESWVNLYPCDCMGQKRYPTKEEALKNAVSDVIATVKIEWEE